MKSINAKKTFEDERWEQVVFKMKALEKTKNEFINRFIKKVK